MICKLRDLEDYVLLRMMLLGMMRVPLQSDTKIVS